MNGFNDFDQDSDQYPSNDNTLYCNAGNDELWGGAGENHLYGGEGDDLLYNENGFYFYTEGARGTGHEEYETETPDDAADRLYGDNGNDWTCHVLVPPQILV